MRIDERGELRILFLDPGGPLVSTPADASDLVGNAWSDRAQVIVIPVEHLDPGFFDLRTGLAGELAQKLVNYRLRLVILGDVSSHEAASDAFRDWVWESNRGTHVWFVPDEGALDAKLVGCRPGPR